MQDKIDDRTKWTCFMSHFDCRADQVVRCRVHCPVRQVYCYPRCHCTQPLGKYSPRIALVDAIVINFGVKKLGCGIVKSLSEASVQNANNGPSTQLIEATSCIERSNATMKAEELC